MALDSLMPMVNKALELAKKTMPGSMLQKTNYLNYNPGYNYGRQYPHLTPISIGSISFCILHRLVKILACKKALWIEASLVKFSF